jgi:hypothetical protein
LAALVVVLAAAGIALGAARSRGVGQYVVGAQQ